MTSLAFRPAPPPRAGFPSGVLQLTPEFVAAVRTLGADPVAVAEPVLEEHLALDFADTGFEWVSEHEIYRVPQVGAGFRDEEYVDLVALAVLAVTAADRRTTTVMLTSEFGE